MGKNAYGYKGFGDAFVLVFFGWTGVLGVYFLHVQHLAWIQWLPATSIGLLAVGVLHLNNLRDIDNDRNSGKMTTAVKLGTVGAKIYHMALIDLSFLGWIIYASYTGYTYTLLCLLGFIPVMMNVILVFKHQNPQELIPALKQLALSTFLISVLFAIGLILERYAS
jgi:1,4-dihydroxy-2-naphthoate octaprenyltransferase